MKRHPIIEKLSERFQASEFLRNALSLIGGTSIAHILPFAVSPILSRQYTREDFDVLAIYMAIVTLFSPVITGTYDQAIMLPKEDDDATQLTYLSALLALLVSLVSVPVVIIWNDQLCQLFKNEDVRVWLYFVPASIFLVSLFNIQQSWSSRKKRFKDVANSLAVQAVGINGINIGLGFFHTGGAGLVIGRLAGQLLSNLALAWMGMKHKAVSHRPSLAKMWANAKAYRDFPRFTAPRVLMDGLRESLLIFLITNMFPSGTLGSYSFMSKVLGVPITMIGVAVSKVYFQKAADAHNRGKNIWYILKPLLIALALMAIPAIAVIVLFGQPIFSFVFGAEWTEAGQFSSLLVPWFMLNFVFIAVYQTPLIINCQRKFLYLMGGLNIGIPGIFALTALLTKNTQQSFLYLSIFGCVYLLAMLGWFFYIVITEKPAAPEPLDAGDAIPR